LGVKTEGKRSLRVGIIGAGVIGTIHARVLGGLPYSLMRLRGTPIWKLEAALKCRSCGRRGTPRRST
jgi:hypothetical protein